MRSRRVIIRLALALALAPVPSLRAAVLDAAGWTVRDSQGTMVTAATDNRLDTAWVTPGAQIAGEGLTIDLGRRCMVQRVVLAPGRYGACYPRGLKVLVGDRADALQAVAVRDTSGAVETSVTFTPAAGRVVRLELSGRGAGYPWSVAELVIMGAPCAEGQPAMVDRVAVAPDAPALVHLAARELRYYLGELTGRGVALVPAVPEGDTSGTVYRVCAPEAAPSYEAWLADPRSRHPERASVRRDAHAVVFEGATPRAVLGAVHAFLDRLGVRWLYPAPLGDFVPPAGELDLEFLPLAVEPAFTRRYANWNTERYEGDGDDYLWYFRNGWNASWGGRLNEDPGVPAPDRRIAGYTHTFESLVPGGLYWDHPDWFPLFKNPLWIPRIGLGNLGKRIPYDTTWGLNFCTGNPEVADYVARRIVNGTAPAGIEDIVWVVPMDAGSFCECKRCKMTDLPKQMDSEQWKGGQAMSNRYFDFIGAVAARVRAERPRLRIGAFAYEGYLQPPTRFPTMPDNVVVDVVQYGVYGLSTTAATNRWMQAVMQGWTARWGGAGEAVGVYDWALLLANAGKMPVPMVTALGQRIRAYHRLGVRRIGTQADADPEVWRYNPWNFYAYSRFVSNPEEEPDTVRREFFDGYYGAAGGAMRDYVTVLERQVLDHELAQAPRDLQYAPRPDVFTEDVVSRMSACLDRAQRAADTWVARRRVADAAEGFAWTLERLPRSGGMAEN